MRTKQLLVSIVMLCLVLAIGACSSVRSEKDLLPGKVRVSIVEGVDGSVPGQKKTKFVLGEMVYLYVSIGWSDVQQIKQAEVKWYNAKGEEVGSKMNKIDYARKPHHAWFWISSAQLGKGVVRADLYADGKFLVKKEFNIVGSSKKVVNKSWYEKLFQNGSTVEHENTDIKLNKTNNDTESSRAMQSGVNVHDEN